MNTDPPPPPPPHVPAADHGKQPSGLAIFFTGLAIVGWALVVFSIATVIGAVAGYADCPRQQGNFALQDTSCPNASIGTALGYGALVFLSPFLVALAGFSIRSGRRRRSPQ